MLAILGASGIRYITYRQRRPGASQAAAYTLLRWFYLYPSLVDVGCHAIHGATDPRRITRRRRPLLFFKDESTWLEAAWEDR